MPLLHVAQLAGRQKGQVDQPPPQEGTTVIDPHDHAAAILQAAHPHIAGQGQGRMGRRHPVHVIGFADGRGLAMKALAIPRGHPLLAIGPAFGHWHEVLPHHRVGAVGPCPQLFGHRHRIRGFHQPGQPALVHLSRAVVQIIGTCLAGTAGTARRQAGHRQRQRQPPHGPALNTHRPCAPARACGACGESRQTDSHTRPQAGCAAAGPPSPSATG